MSDHSGHATDRAAADPPSAESCAGGTDAEFADRSRHLHALRDQVHHTLNAEFMSVTTDLDQLRGLLADAAGRLSTAFREMRHASGEIESLVQRHGHASGDAHLEEVVAAAARIAGNAGSTIQSLQFEDMANQLLQHVNRRLQKVQEFSVEMSVINPSATCSPPFLTLEELDHLFARLEHYRNELRVSTRKVVQQQSLESGDIELF